MHRFPNKSIINRFKLTAVLLCFKYLMIPVISGILIYSLVINDFKLTEISVALAIITVLASILQWLLAARTRCPLCVTPVLASIRCSKHRNARSFLGSHRLQVAVAILLTKRFRCPYCNETAAMEVRVRGQRSKVRND